ncbi:MAG: hypothetical protein LBG69_04060 [Zoogloeaceae bacterium]|nr:hypothetical protein [Zoogloeaceae bacterium]
MFLRGRADRIVKIGENRVSLDQVESALIALPEIDQAKVVLLAGQEGGRDELGAAVCLASAGAVRLGAEGKVRFDRALRQRLREFLPQIALPRRWRYVSEMPVNALGKITREALKDIFAPQFPRVRAARVEDAGEIRKVSLDLWLSPDLMSFAGHFPDCPIFPGVAQIDVAAHFASFHFDVRAHGADLSGVKFLKILRPYDAPRLTLTLKPHGQTLEFLYTLGERTASKGIFHLKP